MLVDKQMPPDQNNDNDTCMPPDQTPVLLQMQLNNHGSLQSLAWLRLASGGPVACLGAARSGAARSAAGVARYVRRLRGQCGMAWLGPAWPGLAWLGLA